MSFSEVLEFANWAVQLVNASAGTETYISGLNKACLNVGIMGEKSYEGKTDKTFLCGAERPINPIAS